MQCIAKIRPFSNINDVELQCEQESGHPEDNYHGAFLLNYAYEGSSTYITWDHADRRNFTGDWVPCPNKGCVLPADHIGNHAY
jgi:hypothetical protein